jgi:Mn-dependent DtxR family transcriptional regulator
VKLSTLQQRVLVLVHESPSSAVALADELTQTGLDIASPWVATALRRLRDRGLVRLRDDGRWEPTPAGAVAALDLWKAAVS